MHQSVMIGEVVGSLNLKPGFVVLDATVGGGGHAKEMLGKILPGGMLIGMDADENALKIAEDNLKYFQGSFRLINSNFRDLDEALAKAGINFLDAVLMDLGISSYQIEDASRGFSIKFDARLDMRMDPAQTLSAYELVNKYKEKDLAQIIRTFGEERFYRRIAGAIIEARRKRPIETTRELTGVIHRAVGSRYKRGRIDPATRTFQAFRIFVNDELGALEKGLRKSIERLKVGARICVISFHSLEDRIVKNMFRESSKIGLVRIITKKPLVPSREEAISNPRSRSAKLRVAERA